ncbi:MAG: hypothetical protein ACK4K6_06115, partial [Pseudarthrobacter sp.]
MNRPDPGPQDQGANPDDAVWLDLVARLESGAPHAGPGSTTGTGTDNDPATDAGPRLDAAAPGGRPPAFRDFDPLGL